MANELATIDQAQALSIYRSPEEALQQASRCAKALADVMSKKKNPVFFPDGKGGKDQYLENEDWQTVSYFYGHTAKVISTEYVDYGDAGAGFNAVAVLVDSNGVEVSRAEAMCLNSEENWGMVTEYAWIDKLDEHGKKIWNGALFGGKGGYERTKEAVGQKPKPLFQLKSMAQTRATSKVIATKFKWVVVLAGYGATPAEEMTGNEFPPDKDRNQAPPPPDVRPKNERAAATTQSAPPTQTPATGEAGKSSQPASASVDPNAAPDIRPRSQKGQATPPIQPQTQQGGVSAGQQQAPQGQVLPPDDPSISDAQARRFFAVCRSAQISDDEVKARLAALGYTGHRDKMPKRIYTAAVDAVDPDFRFHSRDQGR